LIRFAKCRADHGQFEERDRTLLDLTRRSGPGY
jgi:hypothetical protein